MKIRRLLTIFTGCMALLTTSAATAGNGMQFSEDHFSGTLYIDCLGEQIDYEEHIQIWSHVFQTPSGTYHLVDNWKFYLTATGTISGRQWFGSLASPFQYNASAVEVFQYAIRGVIRGVSKDAPNFRWAGYYKSTVNANGDLVVERSADFSAACLGNK